MKQIKTEKNLTFQRAAVADSQFCDSSAVECAERASNSKQNNVSYTKTIEI